MSRPTALLFARSASRASRRGARAWWLLVAASAAAPGGCAALEESPSPAAPAAGRVVRVIDGDTIVVRSNGERLTVRLLGGSTRRSRTAVRSSAAAPRRAVTSSGSRPRAAEYGWSPIPTRATRAIATGGCSPTPTPAVATSANAR